MQLLHNDLIPDIPMALKVKIAYQASKGMHFLHSSGIVHRDLKSLNLLLDNKWNVKVSDFGLTRFKNTIDQRQGRDVEGSVPWMAPELLAELNDVDYSVADVYSYGVILWEVLTRLQPYHGMLPAQIAVGVIRNDIRPSLRADVIQNPATAPFVALMTKCWHRDTTMRPTFVEVMKQLQAMIEDVSGSLLTSTSGGSSSSASTHSAGSNSRRNMTGSSYDSDATDSSNKGGTDSEARASSNDSHSSPRLKYGVTVPRRDVTFVVCDLARCNESWQTNPAGAAKAITRFGQLVRDLSAPAEQTERVNAAAGGYIFSRPGLHSGGTYMLAFPEAARAAAFALHLQREVADRDWPRGVQIYARVALHFAAGVSGAPRDDVTRTGYEPENYDEACKLNLRCRPGAVVCSSAFSTRLGLHPSAADFKLVPRAEDAYQLVSHDDAVDQVERKKGAGDGDGDGEDDEEDEKWAEEQWDQGMGLCSSNCCAWIINTSKISMGAKIGEGNFGRVVAGAYFGTKVAVKQLYKTKLDDLALTKMRKEAAILSGLDHPNIVKLIGLCVSSNGDGGPMLVMELVPRGNLRALLADGSVRLGWKQKLAMLRDAALGLAYLHSRGIVHRDIKSSNLLVEKNLTVKVGDFGFATAKQDNGTQTRCGTPCWTAPEIISGTTAKYSEKADVYSFAIVMWEVLTRKAPYQDKNMMTVALNVINGDRPPVPADCPKAFGDIMQRAWKAKPDRRPTMDDLLMYFNSELGTDRV
jgi:serine/threonine protein kinase